MQFKSTKPLFHVRLSNCHVEGNNFYNPTGTMVGVLLLLSNK